MPLLQVELTDTEPTDQQRTRLQSGLTRLMADVLRKRADLTVVHISAATGSHWFRGGQPLTRGQWCASLVVHVTAGTNTPQEVSAFIEAAHSLFCEILDGPPSAPVYIVINEIPASNWGYDGRTQLARREASIAAAAGG